MASILLRTAGAAVGNALLPGFGGAFLGTLGNALGGAIDGSIGLGSHATGPRLENLSVQDSRYGAGIPTVYGRARVAGNVIWATDLIETTHNTRFSGGKGGALGGGGGSATTYTYSIHCAVGIALGPIGGLTTIWADSTIIYQNGVWKSGVLDNGTLYLGDAAQTPDPFMQSLLGAGNVPAYRGLAYIVFDNLQLADFGSRLPNLTFEITPQTVSASPSWMGEADAQISQRSQTAQSRGMPPIPLNDAANILVGGYVLTGTNAVFQIAHYDMTGNAPVEKARVSSAPFAMPTPMDSSWALGPDGRTVALYVQGSSPSAHAFVLYDAVTQQFGAVSLPTLAASSTTKKIAWLDSQHSVIDDVSSGKRGLRVFAHAGLNVVDLGFFDVWGAVSNRVPFFYTSFIPYAGGLINSAADLSVSNTASLYARSLAWRNNALAVGDPVTIATGLALGTGSGGHANLLQTGDTEWTLCYGNVVDFRLLSFTLSATSATVTRAWQIFTPSFGNGTTQAPVWYGDRLVLVQLGVYDATWRLSEVMLNGGGFALTQDGVSLSNGLALGDLFNATRLDDDRILLMNVGGFAWDIGQLGILRRRDTSGRLDAILADLLTRAGYTSGDYDLSALTHESVDGYVVADTATARQAIEPLQAFAPFDLIESGVKLKAVKRGGVAAMVIDSSEWRAVPEDKETPPPMEITRAQEMDLPREITVDFMDAARNFEINSQRARRLASHARATQKIALPIVCDATAAKQIAESRLYTTWAEREFIRLKISRRWLALEPADVVDLGNGTLLRVTRVRNTGGLMDVEGFAVNAAAYQSAAQTDSAGLAATSNTAQDSLLYLMDLPLLQSADDQAGLYAAATGVAGWRGASAWRSADGVTYSNVASLQMAAVAGIATSLLNDGSALYMDRVNTVTVSLVQGTLASCTEADLYAGANAALLGNEIIQFQTAALVGSGLYTLSNLLRGRRGTESATGGHVLGERFVMLTAGAVDFVPALLTDRGASYAFRAIGKGQTLGDAQDTTITYGLATLRPFAPVSLTATRVSGIGSDTTIAWKRRARLNAEWVDYVDVPLDEPSELYDVEIMNGSSVMRTFAGLTAPVVTYTAAQQTADWGGSIPASFTVRVYQISGRYGRGEAGVTAL